MQIQDHRRDEVSVKGVEFVRATTSTKENERTLTKQASNEQVMQPEPEETANELELAARLESALRTVFPCEVVKAKDGVFTVDVEAPILWESRLVKDFNKVGKELPGVKRVLVHIVSTSMYGLG